ncbi:hypothetical protein ACFPOA_12540 [Lysobacter niabensis]|uniref:hypothetical protein n=1 Tax=Agrilutibacter niabensis TaxID=380628 RepID=UPI003621965C
MPLVQGELETVPVPSESGRGQKIVRCARCHVALRSRYPGGGEIAFVRAGTLTSPSLAPPGLRIHGALKQPWLALPPDARAVDAFYDPRVEWPTEAPQRYRVAEQSGRSNPPFPARPMATPGAADARTG